MKILNIAIMVTVALIVTSTLLIPVINDAKEEPSTLDVIIIDGQSNAEYSSNTARTNMELIDLSAPEHKLMYYGSETAANSYPGSDSYKLYEMYRDGVWQIGGLEPTLAYYYSERSGHDVLTINVARGAMGIAWLKPTGNGGIWAQGCIDKALSEITGYSRINMVGWVMLQGEHDKTMAVDSYKTQFMELDAYFDSIGAKYCYLVKTREYYGGNATIAQNQLVAEHPDIFMATTITDTFTEENGMLVTGDPIHYSQLGRNVIGEAVGKYMIVYESPTIPLLDIIPVLVIVAIVMGAVVAIFIKRD